MDEFLKINNLDYKIFKNFNLSIQKEGFISIIGSNMCGKTTLLKIISGIIPTNDIVICNNIELNQDNVNQYIRQIGVVFPYDDEQFLFKTVKEEMTYPLKNLGYCKSYINKKIKNMLELFQLDILEKDIEELTIDEKQQLLFCLALLHKPKLLLIDDVFSYMENKIVVKVIDILKDINNLTIINFTSSIEKLDVSDYIYVLDNGKIVLEGSYIEIEKEYPKLIKLGIEIPFLKNLNYKLQTTFDTNINYNSLEEMVNDIWK